MNITTNPKYNLRQAQLSDLGLIGHIQKVSLEPHVIKQYGAWDEEIRKKKMQETDPTQHHIIELEGEPIGCYLTRETVDRITFLRL